MSVHFNVKAVMDENGILSTFSPTQIKDCHITDDSPGGASKMSQKDKSSDWQSQRYKKALQRSREIKQQRKSVAPTTGHQTPVTSHNLSDSSYVPQLESKENNAGLHRAIIDTSILNSTKNSKSPIKAGEVSDDMRRVLSTISTNSPPRRIHGSNTTDTETAKGTTIQVKHQESKPMTKKKSPKNVSSSTQKYSSIDVLDHLVEILDSNVPNDQTHPLAHDIHSDRHFQSLAKSIHEKMTQDNLHDGNTHRRITSDRLSLKHMNDTVKGEKVNVSSLHESPTISHDEKKVEVSQHSNHAFTHFILDLKREVSQDHKEVRVMNESLIM